MKRLVKRILLNLAIFIGISIIIALVYSEIKGIGFYSTFFSFGSLSNLLIFTFVYTVGDIIRYRRGKI
jgi:uncharacterized Tic20 family protein